MWCKLKTCLVPIFLDATEIAFCGIGKGVQSKTYSYSPWCSYNSWTSSLLDVSVQIILSIGSRQLMNHRLNDHFDKKNSLYRKWSTQGDQISLSYQNMVELGQSRLGTWVYQMYHITVMFRQCYSFSFEPERRSNGWWLDEVVYTHVFL